MHSRNLIRPQILPRIAALSVALATLAHAQVPLPVPSSLLLNPEFDSSPGHTTLLTVTNTNLDPVNGTVDVEFVYVENTDCLEFNRIQRLTPGDTFTALSTFHNPTAEHGYVYLLAKSPTTHVPISFNFLIGTATVMDGMSALQYEIQPFAFRAIGAQGTPTDVDADLRNDLDGVEYEQCFDEMRIPRFYGQPPFVGPVPPGSAESQLVLINLTGARQFNALVNLFVWNDNRDEFSAQYLFRCWTKVALRDISGIFTNDFLQTQTNQDPNEPIGATAIDNGWMLIDGQLASSTTCATPNPAILGFLIETVGGGNPTASLPFVTGKQSNASLIDLGLTVAGCAVLPDDGPQFRKPEAVPHSGP